MIKRLPHALRPRGCRQSSAKYHELPRPPPTEQPPAETFASPSRPRAYYARPRDRDLPRLQNRLVPLLAFGILGIAGWAGFVAFATNQERLSSSVVRQILTTLRTSSEIRDILGDAIRPEPAWYLNGDPWINGAINLLQGSVDISFRVKGSKNAGTLYFTSIRKSKGMPFTILRFKLICDDGTVTHIDVDDPVNV